MYKGKTLHQRLQCLLLPDNGTQLLPNSIYIKKTKRREKWIQRYILLLLPYERLWVAILLNSSKFSAGAGSVHFALIVCNM